MIHPPLVIAHRGARGLVPFENTIEAFEKAVALGADMVEFDVHQTADGRIVIFHDAHLSDGRAVAAISAAELKDYTRDQGFEAPELAEAVEVLRGRVRLDVEIKARGFEAAVVETLVGALDYGAFVVKSFIDPCVREIKMLDGRIRAGLLLGDDDPVDVVATRLGELFPRRRLQACRADFVSPNHQLLRLGFVRRAHAMGYPVYVWTVNDVTLMRRLIAMRVDAIITDRPDLLLDLLASRPRS